jgi:hypothetical protein
MRKIILVAAMVLASASAHAGERSLSLSGAAGPTVAPQATTTAAPTTQISDVAPSIEAPKYVDRPPAVSAPAPAAVPAPAPAAATAPAATPTTPTAAPVATTKPAKTARVEKPKRKREWTERRIISELHRHGIYW